MTESDTRQQPAAVIRVAALGFDERSRQALAKVLKQQTGSGICLADYHEAAVVLLDMDGGDSDALWQRYRQTPNRPPAVVAAKQPCHEDQAVFVKKPLAVGALLHAITLAARGVHAGGDPAHGSTSPANVRQRAISLQLRKPNQPATAQSRKRRPAPGDATFFNPDDFVLGAMLKGLAQARQTQRALHIRCWGSRHIVLDPQRNEAHTDLSETQIRDLGFISLHSNNAPSAVASLTSDRQLAALLRQGGSTMTTLPLDTFVWKLSLYTSRGRAPQGTDLQQPVYLRQWPNLTRLAAIPDAPRIVALWVRQPRSLLRLFGSLMVPLENILDLYTAACSIGLAGVARRNADALFEPEEPQVHTQRGLLSSIFRKLGGRQAKKSTGAGATATAARKSGS